MALIATAKLQGTLYLASAYFLASIFELKVPAAADAPPFRCAEVAKVGIGSKAGVGYDCQHQSF